MATSTESRASAVRDLFSSDIYKRSQGRRARQLTAAGLAVLALWGLHVLRAQLAASGLEGTRAVQWLAGVIRVQAGVLADVMALGVPFLLAAAGAWAIFRLLNHPRFADFLIATEAEMAKVSWSTKAELIRATMVVLTSMFLLSLFLYVVDWVWLHIMELIGVLRTPTESAPAAGDASSLWSELCRWIG
jgi:preprotein translocase subunit SecE